jgi:hypothetical protein
MARFVHLIPPPPRRTEVIAADARGVKAERITTPRSLHNRYVMHLHGGAYLLGFPARFAILPDALPRGSCAGVVHRLDAVAGKDRDPRDVFAHECSGCAALALLPNYAPGSRPGKIRLGVQSQNLIAMGPRMTCSLPVMVYTLPSTAMEKYLWETARFVQA